MVVFKFVIADPKTRKSYKVEKDQNEVVGLVGKKIGDKFNGDLIGLKDYEITITGGTDKDGFPMHPNVHGMVKKKIILSGPPCFHPKRKGMRKRKMVVGNTISKSITQINCKIIKEGSKKIEELMGKKEEKPAEGETPKEEKKPEVKETKEKPKEEKKEKPAEKPKEEEKKEEPVKEEKKEPPKEEKKEQPKENPKEEKSEEEKK